MEPKVTVICETYNQEPFISAALDSILAQQTTFPFVVLVGDDASTDATPEIIESYAKQHPDIIIPILRDENIGGGRNWADMLSHASTEFIAFCDGDDYWCDCNKLQKQYDLMSSNKELRACFHDTQILDQTEGGRWFLWRDYSHTKDGSARWPGGNRRFVKKKTYSLENYIPFGFVHTSSMFIRWDYEVGFPDWIPGHGFSDFPMWALQVNAGSFGYIDQVMSAYRRYGKSEFDFHSRYEFWLKSKPGSVEIDLLLIDYFSNEKPLPHIVKALRRRESDDLSKLIKAADVLLPSEEASAILIEHSEEIKRLFNVDVPAQLDDEAYRAVYKLIEAKAPLPPYNVSIASRSRRLFNRFIEMRTLTK